MLVTNMYLIGTLSVPSTWIALIIAFIVTYTVIRIRRGKYLAEVLSDAFFFFIIVWKLSVVVTDFSTVLKSPISIIYFNGGILGFYLGLLVAGARIAIEIRNKNLPNLKIAILFAGVVTVQAIYQLMMVFLNEGGLVAQIMTISIFTLFSLFVWMNIEKLGNWPIQLAIMFLAVHLFAAAFQDEGITGTPVIATIGSALFFAVAFSVRQGTEVESEVRL